MLPLREVRPRPLARAPWIVLALVAANVAAFVWELGQPARSVLDWAFVPRALQLAPVWGVLTIFSSMFLHGGWMHLLGNLWFLWIFGPSVEEALGSRRFGLLYLASGVAAALAQAFFDPTGRLPMLGASGAIGGVLAAYVSLHPFRRIDTLAFILVWPIPALFFVVEWFAINLLRGIGALEIGRGDGTAWWAHVGGFLAGIVLVRLLFPHRREVEEAPRALPGDVQVRGPDGRVYAVRTQRPSDPEQEDDRYRTFRSSPGEWVP